VLILGATKEQLDLAASKVGIGIENLRVGNHGARFTLRLLGPKPEKYARKVKGHVAAVCWHGCRDFLVALLALNPKIRVRAAVGDHNRQLRGEGDTSTCLCQTKGLD
jgi:hypothetical protein